MAIIDSRTSPSSSKNRPSTTKSLVQVVSQVVWEPSSTEYKFNCLFMDTYTYCSDCQDSNRVDSDYRHLKQDTHFVQAENQNYETYIGMDGDHPRQTPILAVKNSQLPPSGELTQRNFHVKNNKWRTCDRRHSTDSTQTVRIGSFQLIVQSKLHSTQEIRLVIASPDKVAEDRRWRSGTL